MNIDADVMIICSGDFTVNLTVLTEPILDFGLKRKSKIEFTRIQFLIFNF